MGAGRAGFALIAAGDVWISTRSAGHHSILPVIPPLAVIGVGFALALSSVTAVAVNAVPGHFAGMAAGTTSQLRDFGSTLGPAVIGSVALSAPAATIHGKLAAGGSLRPAEVGSRPRGDAAHSGVSAVAPSTNEETPVTSIVRDQWYVAAFGREVGRELFSRTVCGESILFWRTEAGEVAAMSDRCVHRRFPLSEKPSHLLGDTVVCGYHGFTYGADGTCVAVPGQTRVPRTARLKAYPVVEQDSFVWVFIGEPDKAENAAIPRAPYLDAEGWTVVSGMEPLAARASLLVDNLMDLSHETYLHGGYIGTPEVADTPITTEVDDEAGIIYVSRHMDDAECPPFYATSTGLEGRISRWQDIEFTPPCLYKLHSRIAPVGSTPDEDGSDPGAFHVEVVYAITPETEHSTHDFWLVARDFALHDQEVSDFMAENNRTVVLQDVVALDKLEQVLAGEPDGYQELSINIDTGGLAARRMIDRLAAGEMTAVPTGARR